MDAVTTVIARVTLSICTWSVAASASEVPAVSDDGLWRTVAEIPQEQLRAQPWVRPEVFTGVLLDEVALSDALAAAPMEFTRQAAEAPARITLPMPDGGFARFEIVESPIMAPGLAVKFPEIKTYSGQGIDDPAARVRLDWTPAGFHAQVLSPNGAVYIDPFTKNDTSFYASYYKRDYGAPGSAFECMTAPGAPGAGGPLRGQGLRSSGDTLRTYRLACACTGEYAQYHGGSVKNAMTAIATAVNRVTGIYEAEVAVRMILIEDNELIVYTDAASDPYTNNSGGTMLDENQTNLDTVIGSSNYDIGHVFSTGGGGIAGLGVVCWSDGKAWGVTGLPSPTGDTFYVDYVAHEMGHQFGGNHTFNGVNGSCSGGNRNGGTAYEPGSGATIMAYAGICTPDDNLQNFSDPYFHSESYREIINFVTGAGGSCAAATATGNNVPTVDAGPDYTIPMGTPFALTGSGSDPDDDAITYCWEERDLGMAQEARDMVDNGFSPLFRSFNPTTDPSRTFPRLSDILDNTTTIGEVLPSTTRKLDYWVMVRDNRAGGGGVAWDDMRVNVDSGAGPFRITSPDEPGTWSSTLNVVWDVAGTDDGSVNVAEVDILLSTDGGESFPIVLVPNTPNDGAETVTLPAVETTAARIKVKAVGNVFFAISPVDFGVGSFNTPAPAPAPHSVVKNRYVSFDPNNPDTAVAFRFQVVDMGCSVTGAGCIEDDDCKSCVSGPKAGDPCVSNANCDGADCLVSGETCEQQGAPETIGWIGEPCRIPEGTQVPADTFTALVVSEMPLPRLFTEPVIQVTDCEIQPRRAYAVSATVDGATFSGPLIIHTILEPAKNSKKWADVVGRRDPSSGEYTEPNRRINVDDIAVFMAFLNGKSYRPHITILDLSHEVVNYKINADDLSLTLRAFNATEDYPPVKFQVEASGAVHPRDCPLDAATAQHDKCE